MPSSPERHKHCTHNYSSERLNPFMNNIEVQLNSNESTSINPFNLNAEDEVISVPPTNSLIPPYKPVIAEPSKNNNNDSSVKIRGNANNIIIRMNDKSTTTVEDEASKLKLHTKDLYQGTKATITDIIPRDDDFLEPVYKRVHRLGISKLVSHHDIILDLLAIPSDISFPTKASDDNTNNSFDTADTNSFLYPI